YSTLRPKPSTAICAAVIDPCPVEVAAGPFISVRTPILTTSSDTCASEGREASDAKKIPARIILLLNIALLLILFAHLTVYFSCNSVHKFDGRLACHREPRFLLRDRPDCFAALAMTIRLQIAGL